VSATTDLATAREWIGERFAPGGPAEFFLSPTRFVSCERTPDSWSMTLSGEQCYGLGFGPAPPINPEWTRCSIDQSRLGERVGQLVARDAWDFYSLDTSTPRAGSKPPVVVETVSDDAAIERILRAHAPHSQVWPGNAEVANWFGVRTEAGQWASIAALVRWESGSYVLASIATIVDLRGRGYVRQLLSRQSSTTRGGATSRGSAWAWPTTTRRPSAPTNASASCPGRTSRATPWLSD
jgi:hypothetical protein